MVRMPARAQMLMASLRDTKRRIISETQTRWRERPMGSNSQASEVVNPTSPDKKDRIVNNEEVLISLHELYTLSCDPQLEDQLGAEEEVRLWGDLPPCYRSRYIVDRQRGVRRRPLKNYPGWGGTTPPRPEI